MITKTVFRKYSNGDIIALFPEELAQYPYCMSYMHIGQHGGADYNLVVRETRPATENEYATLKKELESRGYTIKVYQRKPTNKKKRSLIRA